MIGEEPTGEDLNSQQLTCSSGEFISPITDRLERAVANRDSEVISSHHLKTLSALFVCFLTCIKEYVKYANFSISSSTLFKGSVLM